MDTPSMIASMFDIFCEYFKLLVKSRKVQILVESESQGECYLSTYTRQRVISATGTVTRIIRESLLR